MEVLVIILWAVFSWLVGQYAKSLGRSALLFFILSLLFSPLATFIILAITGKKK